MLLAAASAAGCARRKGRGFPGYAFIANAGSRTVAAVDLNAFVLARQIGMEGAPSEVLRHISRPAAFVLIPGSGVVCEIDAERLAISRKTRLGGPALSMLSPPDGRSLWVLQTRSLVRLETERLRAVETIQLPAVAAARDIRPLRYNSVLRRCR